MRGHIEALCCDIKRGLSPIERRRHAEREAWADLRKAVSLGFNVVFTGVEYIRPVGESFWVANKLRALIEYVRLDPRWLEKVKTDTGIRDDKELENQIINYLSDEWSLASLGLRSVPFAYKRIMPAPPTLQNVIDARSKEIKEELKEALEISKMFPRDALIKFARQLEPTPRPSLLDAFQQIQPHLTKTSER